SSVDLSQLGSREQPNGGCSEGQALSIPVRIRPRCRPCRRRRRSTDPGSGNGIRLERLSDQEMTNTELLRHHVGMVARPTQDGDREIYHDDVVMTLMYSPEGHTHTLEGPEAIMRFMARIEQFFEIKSRPAPVIVETSNGALAEYKGDMVCIETQAE